MSAAWSQPPRAPRHGERPFATRGAWLATIALWVLILGGLLWFTGWWAL